MFGTYDVLKGNFTVCTPADLLCVKYVGWDNIIKHYNSWVMQEVSHSHKPVRMLRITLSVAENSTKKVNPIRGLERP